MAKTSQTRVNWVAKLIPKALEQKYIEEQVNGITKRMIWLRGFHYWLLSTHQRIPLRNESRPYGEAKHEYKDLCKYVKDARIQGLIDEDLIWDNRNPKIIEREDREKLHDPDYYISTNLDTFNGMSLTPIYLRSFPEFEDLEIYGNTYIGDNKFANQFYEIVVCSEKPTVKVIIEPLCREYGAHLMITKGNPSVTRITELCKLSKEAKRPILLLGIYDLDYSGWHMPKAILNTIQQIYPHEHHKLERVGILREQTEQYNITEAFDIDDKGIADIQKQEFTQETNGKTCFELDALDNDIIEKLLEKHLIQYSSVKLDRMQKRRLKKKYQNEIDAIVGDYDIEEHRQEYQRALKSYNRLQENIKRYNDIQRWIKAYYSYRLNKFRRIEEKIQENIEV